MPDPKTYNRLNSFVLSADELRRENPDWTDAMIEDYLNIINNLKTIADLLDVEIDQLLEEIATNFADGSIPFADSGFVIEDTNLTWDKVNFILSALNILTNKVAFNTAAGLVAAEGEMTWNDGDGTLDIGMPGGNVILQVGQEGLLKVVNKTGALIANGKLVYITGSQGNRPTVSLADNSTPDTLDVVGMTTEDIADNANGYVTLWGKVRELDTSAYSEGDKLYLGTSGNFTGTHPPGPTDGVIVIGHVTRSHANEGEVLISGMEFFSLGNDHNVTLRQSVLNANSGTGAAAGFTAVNDLDYFATFGVGSSGNSEFPNNTVFFGLGYNDNLYACAGNKSHKWYNDPDDNHSAVLANNDLTMELDADGNLTNTGYISNATLDAQLDPTGFDASDTALRGDIAFDDTGTNRDFSISVQGGETYFNFWVNGVEYRKESTETIEITDVEGIHLIYYDSDATLKEIVNPTGGQVDSGIRNDAFVSIIYYNTTLGEAIYVGDERHLNQMSGSTHAYLHATVGLAYVSGLGLNSIIADGTGITAEAQFGVDAGAVADEDLYHPISSVASTTGLPIYYMLGAEASPSWTRYIESGFSMRTEDGTSGKRLAYNQLTGGSWQLTEIGNNRYVLCHVFATTEKDNPMIAVIGQNDYATKPAAQEGALTEIFTLVTGDILFPEIRAIGTVIFQTSLTYGSAINGKIVSTDEGDDYIDWRNQVISRTEVSTTDHGSLTGLGDDDHPQYVLNDGETTDITSGTFSITTTGDINLTGNVAASGTVEGADFIGPSGAATSISSQSGEDIVIDNGVASLTMDATTPLVTLTADEDVTISTTDGRIYLDANGAAEGDITLNAADRVDITAIDQIGISTGADINATLGNTDGTTKLSIKNSTPTEVASVTDKGHADFERLSGTTEWGLLTAAASNHIYWTVEELTVGFVQVPRLVGHGALFTPNAGALSNTMYIHANSGVSPSLYLVNNDLTKQFQFTFQDSTWKMVVNTPGAGTTWRDDFRLEDDWKLEFGDSADVEFHWDDAATPDVFETNFNTAADWEINCGTDKTLELVEPVYNVVSVPATSMKFDSGGVPPTEIFNYKDGYVLSFPHTPDSTEVFFNITIPHDYNEGSNIICRLHWTTATSGSGGAAENVEFQLKFSASSPTSDNSESWPASTSGNDIVDVKDVTADEHLTTTQALLTGTNYKVSETIICNLGRDISVANPYSNSVYLVSADFLYESTRIGSRTIFSE